MSSGHRSKSRRGRWIILILAAVIALLNLAGPSLSLKAALYFARGAAREQGLTLSCADAKAAFFFNSASIEGLKLEKDGQTLIELGLLRLEDPSVLDMLSLARSPEGLTLIKAVQLAEGLRLEGLRYHNIKSGGSLELGRLEADKSGGELSLLRLENLVAAPGPAPNAPRFAVGAMTAGGVDITALTRILLEDEKFNILLFCDTLDMAQSSFSVGDEEYLGLRRAIFDMDEEGGGSARYRRTLDLTLNLTALAAREKWLSQEPAFMALLEATGGSMPLSLNLNFFYNPEDGAADFQEFLLESPGLGQLRASGRLLGVSEIKPSFTPYQLLFTSANGLLENLSLSYSDQGFMPAWYRALDRTIFRQSPARQSAANLMDFYINPLAEELEGENSLENLPALTGEIRAFLGDPKNAAITCAPHEPFPLLSLAKLDKYDIIEKLNLSVQVNQRVPISVITAQGVSPERLPSAPRPLDNSFTEENIDVLENN